MRNRCLGLLSRAWYVDPMLVYQFQMFVACTVPKALKQTSTGCPAEGAKDSFFSSYFILFIFFNSKSI